jgi:hypothetical protein
MNSKRISHEESYTELRFQGSNPSKEQERRARIERLLGTTPKLTTAAKLFDYHEASRIARRAKP